MMMNGRTGMQDLDDSRTRTQCGLLRDSQGYSECKVVCSPRQPGTTGTQSEWGPMQIGNELRCQIYGPIDNIFVAIQLLNLGLLAIPVWCGYPFTLWDNQGQPAGTTGTQSLQPTRPWRRKTHLWFWRCLWLCFLWAPWRKTVALCPAVWQRPGSSNPKRWCWKKSHGKLRQKNDNDFASANHEFKTTLRPAWRAICGNSGYGFLLVSLTLWVRSIRIWRLMKVGAETKWHRQTDKQTDRQTNKQTVVLTWGRRWRGRRWRARVIRGCRPTDPSHTAAAAARSRSRDQRKQGRKVGRWYFPEPGNFLF